MTFLGGNDLQRQVYQFLERQLRAPDIPQLTEDERPPAGRG
jgi:hypothetical protein